MIKSAKEARELLDLHINTEYPWDGPPPEIVSKLYIAKGYLAALEGPEVKALVELLEKRIADGSAHCCEDCPCGYWARDLELALYQFRKAVKVP